MTDCDLAWAAGLFDGEGTATICRGRRRLAVKMTDQECVQRFGEIVKRGKVYGPYGNVSAERADGHKRQPTFIWLAEQDDADVVAALLFPLVGEDKRRSIAERFDVEALVLT